MIQGFFQRDGGQVSGMKMPKEFRSRPSYSYPLKASGIEIELPEDARVMLKIYGGSGAEVATVIDNKEYKAGTHTVELKTDAYPHGVYIYRLLAQGNEN